MMKVTSLLQDFLYLIFPNSCYVCSEPLVKGEQYICSKCILNLPKTNYHHQKDNPLEKRFYGKVPLKHVVSYFKFIKNGSVSALLYKLKYENIPELGEVLGQWYGLELKEAGFDTEYDLIIPVPLHVSKIRKRGYNQSDCIAKGISKALGIPFDEKALIRTKKNESQTRKGRLERWENVNDIFKLVEDDKLTNKRILLVDDVLTTGATLESCAYALFKGGIKELGIATIAAA